MAGEEASFGAVIESRWTKFKHDRVYLKTSDGSQIGYIDLKTGDVHAESSGFDKELADCRQRWQPKIDELAARAAARAAKAEESEKQVGPLPPPVAPTPAPTASGVTPPRVPIDLSLNPPGSAPQAKREEINAEAPVRNMMARVLGVRTKETGWREGAIGEQKVAEQLAKLGAGWKVLHSVPIGNRGSDIDHVVIGPGGVFCLNTKRHKDGKATVYQKSIYVNGEKTEFLRKSQFEQTRSTELLTAACGFPVHAWPVIVFVDLAELEVKHQPDEVYVVARRRLVEWLQTLPAVLDPRTVEVIWANARWDTTWQPPGS